MSRNLIARLAVAAIAIPIILWICYQGGWWFVGMVCLFATAAIIEFCLAEKVGPKQFEFWAALLMTPVLMISVAYQMAVQHIFQEHWITELYPDLIPLMIAFAMIVVGLRSVARAREPRELFSTLSRVSWGVLYVSLLYSFVLAIGLTVLIPQNASYTSGDLMLFLFGLLWVGDTAAMAAGKMIGKHKLAPTVSPNKTVEGFLGGLVGAALVGVLMSYWRLTEYSAVQLIVVAVLCSVAGQTGDLVESMWKRSLGIKDSSAIIPGHGGVLDRFDSLLFAAPVLYFILRWTSVPS